jgi:hypothetical protein
LGGGLRQATEDAVERATGRGAELAGVNRDLGNLLTTAKMMGKETAQAEGKNMLTQIDAMLLALGHPGVFAAKQGAKFFNSPLFKTGAGLALNAAGTQRKLPLDVLLRRALVEGGQE